MKIVYDLKQKVHQDWWLKDITGKKKAIENMKRDLEALKKYDHKSKYIKTLEDFISEKEKEV